MSDNMIRFNGGHLELFKASSADFENDLIKTPDGTSISTEKAKAILSDSNQKEKAQTLIKALSEETLNQENVISGVQDSFDMYNNADPSKKTPAILNKIEEKSQKLKQVTANAEIQAALIKDAMNSLNAEYLNKSELTGLIANIRNFTKRARE
jgi:hypothetical protein